MPADTKPLIDRPGAPAPRKEMNPVLKMLYKPFKHYAVLKIVGILCMIHILVMTFSPAGTIGWDPVIGSPGNLGGFVSKSDLCTGVIEIEHCIVDPGSATRTELGLVEWKGAVRPIIARSVFQMIALGISRGSAFYLYPCMILVFTTKFRASMEAIAQSPFGMFTYNDLHELHVFCGWMCVVDGTIHTILHCTRWLLQGNINLLVDSRSGASGIAALLCMWLIGIPMGYEPIRSRVAYEYRRYLHYLFVIFCVAMAFHAPFSTIPNGGFAPIVFPTLILWWFLDSMYVYFYMTEKISTSTFHVLPTGVQLTMTVSERFQKVAADGGYCYINLPWISKHQWHAYSLFENPANPKERQVFMMKLGDWTSDVLTALQRDTKRPSWICGPFSSPYDNAIDVDHQILVAGGIGITPALSVMRKHQDSRRPNLIWACRDPHMLEFFCKNGEFSRRGWNMIFYTGKAAIYVGDANEIVTKNGAIVHIVRARPNLGNLIPNIIYSIESGEYVPEDYISESKADAIAQMQEKLDELDEMNLTSKQKMQELMAYSDQLGFLFTDLIQEVSSAAGVEVDAITGGSTEAEADDKRSALLSNVKAYKSTKGIGPPRGTLGRASISKPRGRATVAWGAMDSGFDKWMEDFEANSYKPWVEDSSDSRDYVNRLDKDLVLQSWGAMYCGGQGPLATNLRKACKEFGLSLAIESFKW